MVDRRFPLWAMVVTAAMGFAVGLIGPALLGARPSNFEECLLNEMRGMSNEFGTVAARLCQRRFPAAATE